ncbi:hypothetical protein M0R45_017987 [Rubus argutus]|uniref:S1 motif domain-containing protein n=1 Tax=Rubus argutus TaxID=59490 RepID=A0AAW1XX48_RUBAR
MAVSVKKLEYLSLISKVCSELETNLGHPYGDKALAEFITEMGRNCKTGRIQCQIERIRCRNPRLLCPYSSHYHSHSSRSEEARELFYRRRRVTRVMDAGCFVELTSFRGKEGMVHVSQITNRRLRNAKDVVKKEQQVYVKVVSISGQKFSLSMRDVDQKTGKDLLPLKKSSEDYALRLNPNPPVDGCVTRTGPSRIRIVEADSFVPSHRPLRE